MTFIKAWLPCIRIFVLWVARQRKTGKMNFRPLY